VARSGPNWTDVYAQANLWFDDHRYLHFECLAAFDEQGAPAEVSSYTIAGDQGIIHVRDLWATNRYGSLVMCDPGGWRSVQLDPINPYLGQYRLLTQCQTGAEVPAEVSISRGLADLRILYAIADSAAAAAELARPSQVPAAGFAGSPP
jgi:hypothetical protein